MSIRGSDNTRRSNCGEYTNEVAHYGEIVVALKETIRIVAEIDEVGPLASSSTCRRFRVTQARLLYREEDVFTPGILVEQAKLRLVSGNLKADVTFGVATSE